MERHEELKRVFNHAEITVFDDDEPYVAVWYGGYHISVYPTHDGVERFGEEVVQSVDRDNVDEETVKEALELVKTEE